MLLPTVVFLAGQAAAFGFGFDKARAFASTADGRYKISPYEAPVRGDGTPNNESTWKLSIDDTPSGFKQRVTGFGAALTETTVDVFNQLPKHRLEKLLREIMTNEGNSFGVIRHTIGSSDLSPEPAMSYDDNGGNAGHVDLTLSHFNIDPRGRAMAKMLKSMRDLNNDMTILGSCWSPPGWMKWDGMFVGAGNNTLDHAYSKQYGDYFVRYIQAYEEIGAHIDAITIQNEPLNNNSGMPSMVIEAAEEGGLIHNHVAPSLREAGFDTEIWAWDHNTGKSFCPLGCNSDIFYPLKWCILLSGIRNPDHPYYPQTVLDMNPNLVNTVAWHCYANPIIWEVLTEFYHNNSHIPGFRQFMTECWTSNEYTGWNQVRRSEEFIKNTSARFPFDFD